MPPAATPRSRPYRSSKRNKPCDRCRETKIRCQIIAGSQCAKCQRDGLHCSFSTSSKPHLGHVQHSEGSRTPTSAVGYSHESSPGVLWSRSPMASAAAGPSLQHHSLPVSAQPTPSKEQETDIQFNTQFSQSLEGMQGYSAQLFGSSSESDPWLLRHCRFDDFGTRSFQNTRYRNAGGLPLAQKIPIHLILEPNELHETAKEETRAFDRQIASREDLNRVVPLDCGQKLVALFCDHVFPILPVVSRFQLGITSANRVPPAAALERCPLHLLGAMYALALRFVPYDEHLAVWFSQTSLSADTLWRFVYEELQEHIHQPGLSVVQASLLYLHKEPADEKRYSLTDTPFTWSWTGQLVGLTTSLGLHTECSMWAIPSWEKRLRRRLWWAVYAEDKWRSLLLGRPPYIHSEEWDVEGLDSSHFGPVSADLSQEEHIPFQSFVGLTQIAESVQEAFYSLRASQKLSIDMGTSIGVARPLLQRLEAWRSSSADFGHLSEEPSDAPNGIAGPRSSLQFAYHLLVIYVYRALFRPMVQSMTPPHVIDLEEPIVFDSSLDLANFNWDVPGLSNITPFPAANVADDSRTEVVEDITRAATECAAGMINRVRRFSFGDLSSFWHSWSRIGFAVTSNFLVLLVVQAPNAQSALKAKQLLEVWGQTLTVRCSLCPMVRLGMLRLNSLDWAGLPETFHLPPHVEQVLNRDP